MLATPSSLAPNFIANADPNLKTRVVSITFDLTRLRKFSFSIEEADMEALLAMPPLCSVRSISASAEAAPEAAKMACQS
jgi:hypothetical protein